MKVLVACEESQRVCTAFRQRGHEAYSCDIQEPSGGHPEWHILGDCLPIINGRCTFYTMDGTAHRLDSTWDLLIAHPPCTYLSNAGAPHLFRGGTLNEKRYQKGIKAKEFFLSLLNADCPHIAVENPVSSKIFQLPKFSQEIQPYQFGHPMTKKTRLWLKNLPNLIPTQIAAPQTSCQQAGSWYTKGGKDRQKNRSKTFPGIADAMAEQWGDLK